MRRLTYNNIDNIDDNNLNHPYMSNTITPLTSDDILTQAELVELERWGSVKFSNDDLNHIGSRYEISSPSSGFVGTSSSSNNNNNNNIVHPHGFISLAAANQYPIFNYPTTTNSIAVMPTTMSTRHQLQSIFPIPPPTSSISRVAIPGSLIDNNNSNVHQITIITKKESANNDAPKSISTNQKTLLPKPLTSISSNNNNNNNNSRGHDYNIIQKNESRNQSSSSSVIMSDDDNDDDDSDDNDDLGLVKQDQTAKLTADEDKRRRNTAASARFRVKKKLREKELERTAKEMTAKTKLLDERVKELEMENKWLRNLIVEKDVKLLSDVIDKNKNK